MRTGADGCGTGADGYGPARRSGAPGPSAARARLAPASRPPRTRMAPHSHPPPRPRPAPPPVARPSARAVQDRASGTAACAGVIPAAAVVRSADRSTPAKAISPNASTVTTPNDTTRLVRSASVPIADGAMSPEV